MTPRSDVVLFGILLIALMGCAKKKLSPLERIAKERGVQLVEVKEEVEAEEAAPVKKADDLATHLGDLRRELMLCKRQYLDKFAYEQLNDGLPPVSVNGFDDVCKKLLERYEVFDERWAGKHPEVDAFMADFSLLADSVFMLSGMLKNLGTRRLSALVARMKIVQKEALGLTTRLHGVQLPTDEGAWKPYAELSRARFAGEPAGVKALAVAANALHDFFGPRVMENVKKDQMVYYVAFVQRHEALKRLASALGLASSPPVADVLSAWDAVRRVMDGDFQNDKAGLLRKAKAAGEAGEALAKKAG